MLMIDDDDDTYLETAIKESLAEVGIILPSDALENRFQELTQLNEKEKRKPVNTLFEQ